MCVLVKFFFICTHLRPASSLRDSSPDGQADRQQHLVRSSSLSLLVYVWFTELNIFYQNTLCCYEDGTRRRAYPSRRLFIHSSHLLQLQLFLPADDDDDDTADKNNKRRFLLRARPTETTQSPNGIGNKIDFSKFLRFFFYAPNRGLLSWRCDVVVGVGSG